MINQPQVGLLLLQKKRVSPTDGEAIPRMKGAMPIQDWLGQYLSVGLPRYPWDDSGHLFLNSILAHEQMKDRKTRDRKMTERKRIRLRLPHFSVPNFSVQILSCLLCHGQTL